MEKKAASITLIENHMPSSGIGNYKGVMLCNRPFAGTQGAHTLKHYRNNVKFLT